jgi:hypothetical protein
VLVVVDLVRKFLNRFLYLRALAFLAELVENELLIELHADSFPSGTVWSSVPHLAVLATPRLARHHAALVRATHRRTSADQDGVTAHGARERVPGPEREHDRVLLLTGALIDDEPHRWGHRTDGRWPKRRQ